MSEDAKCMCDVENSALEVMNKIWLSNISSKRRTTQQHASLWLGRCMNGVLYHNQKSVDLSDT